MRKVVVYELLSLDGVAENPDAFIAEWHPVLDTDLGEVIAPQDAVILGRHSYDQWSRFWPTSDIEPFAAFINAVAKYVATSTPLSSKWANATVIQGELTDFVRELRDCEGGDIGVHASISVARTLIAAGLVDELRLVLAPTIAGGGRRLLDELPSSRLELLRAQTAPSGHLMIHYRIGK